MSEEQANYKTRKQTIFRTIKNQDNPFVMIDRRPIENPSISWKAKGILAYLLSRPDNWIVRLGDLVKRSPEGVHAVRGAIKELEAAGHVSRKEVRDTVTKQFIRYELEVYELPFTSKPLTSFPQADNPQAENLTLNDTDCNENELTNGVPPTYPIEWQVAGGNQTVIVTDEKYAQRLDASNLIATGTGLAFQEISALAMAFQVARDKTFTMSDIKGQRKAAKMLLEKNVKPFHVSMAVKKLLESEMTVTDLYSIIKTADDIANPPPEVKTMNPQGLEIGL